MSVDFEALVCQTQIEPNSTQRTSLRNVVKNIITDRETLKNMFNQTFGVFDSIKGRLLQNLKDLKEYQDGFDKSDGWYWRPTTWNLANNKLKECVTILGNFIERQDFTDKDEEEENVLTELIDQCNTCLEHMENYKEICETIPLTAELSMYERTMRRGGLKSQLEVLEDLHNV